MKKTLIRTTILILILYGNAFSRHNELVKKLEDLELSGNIESVKIKETAVGGQKFSLIRKYVISDIEYKIISSENKAFSIKHIEQGIVVTYKYDNEWQIKEIENKYLEKYNVLAGKKTYHYDNKILSYELDYGKDGKMKDSIAVSYDNQTKVKLFYTANKEFYKKEIINYNEQFNELANSQEIGGTSTLIICEYDSTGTKKILDKWYLDDKLVQTIKYNYDEKGFLINTSEFDEKGHEGSITNFEYDLITGLITTIKTGENITTFDYNLDINDNWIVKYEYYNDYPVKIIERTIKYNE